MNVWDDRNLAFQCVLEKSRESMKKKKKMEAMEQ